MKFKLRCISYKEAENKKNTHLNNSSMTISRHAGVRPFLWKASFASLIDNIGSFLHLHQSLSISDQNFIFISQDSGLTVFNRKGAKSAFIRTSSDQQCGSFASGITLSGNPILGAKTYFPL